MKKTKFTILGMSGSGKTCYLLGMYYKMGAGMRGFTMTTDEDEDVKLRDRYRKLSDNTIGKERFPVGTDNISKYLFDLQYGYKTVMPFDWVDYPGGVLDRKNEGNLEEYEAVKTSIMESSCLFICIDGSLLVGDDTEEKIDKVKDNCSAVINTFFTDYQKNNNTLPPTAIIVTKYDVCKDDTDEDELCKIVEEAFSPFFTKDKENQKIVTIIPTSIGVNIEESDYSGKLKPLNIHLPIFMGIWFAISKQMQEYNNFLKEENLQYDNNIASLKMQRNKQLKKWIFVDITELNKISEQMEEVENSNKNLNQEMEGLIKAYTENSGKIIKELEKIPFVYVDGEKIDSFTSIINN